MFGDVARLMSDGVHRRFEVVPQSPTEARGLYRSLAAAQKTEQIQAGLRLTA